MKKLISIIFIFLPIFAFAQSEYQLLEPIPCIANSGQVCGPDGMTKTINATNYIDYVYNFSIAFAAVAAVLVIVYSGFEYATSNSESGKSDAKKHIYNAIWGLLTILASYLILQTVDPRLVDVSVTLEPVGLKGVTFDYNDLVFTATDYQVRKDLAAAGNEADRLEAEMRKLRDLANSEPDEDKSIEYRQKALELEKQARLVRGKAAVDAQYKLLGEKLDEYGFYKQGTKEMKVEFDDYSAQINGAIDKEIARLTSLGAVDEVKIMEQRRIYYQESLRQEVATEKALQDYKNFSGSLPINQRARILAVNMEKGKTPTDITQLDFTKQGTYAPTSLITDPELKQKFDEETKARIDRIREVVPPLKEELDMQNNPPVTPPPTP